MLVAVLSILANRGFRDLISNTLALKRLQGRLVDLKKEETDLKFQVDLLKKNDIVLENSARHELGYLKSREIEYRFQPPKK